MRKEFSSYLKKLISKNKNIFALLGDISVGLFLDEEENLYKNVLNLGLIEQSMISYAAGLARSGCIPFIHTISPFIIERAYEQIKLDLVYNNCKCILVSANGPYDYNKLGPTHHCASDVPLISLLEDIEIFLPGRNQDVKSCIDLSISNSKSSYIRLNSYSIDNEKISSGKIISGKSKNEILNIYLGEAINILTNTNLASNNSDHLYVFSYSHIPDDLTMYKKIVFWEPYSVPVFATKFRNDRKSIQNILSNVYPSKIETGIFEFPPNYKETIV